MLGIYFAVTVPEEFEKTCFSIRYVDTDVLTQVALVAVSSQQ